MLKKVPAGRRVLIATHDENVKKEIPGSFLAPLSAFLKNTTEGNLALVLKYQCMISKNSSEPVVSEELIEWRDREVDDPIREFPQMEDKFEKPILPDAFEEVAEIFAEGYKVFYQTAAEVVQSHFDKCMSLDTDLTSRRETEAEMDKEIMKLTALKNEHSGVTAGIQTELAKSLRQLDCMHKVHQGYLIPLQESALSHLFEKEK